MAKAEVVELEFEIRRAHELTREGNCGEAYQRLRDVRAALSEAGIESAFVCWVAAVAADGLGLVSEAIELIGRACAGDPACPQFLHSRRIIHRQLEDFPDAPIEASRSTN